MGRIGVIVLLSVLVLFGTTSVLFAQGNVSLPFRQGEKISLEKNEVVDRDFFAAGEQVEIKGTVNGDVYVAGGNVIVEGTVRGDVLAAGGQIDIPGKVDGNIRVAGGNIQVSGAVGKNITALGGNVEIEKQATVGGSAVIGAGNVDVGGVVMGNIVGGVGNLVVSNIVEGNIYTGVGQLQINDGARIAGNIVYWSEEDAVVDSEATVSGAIEKRIPVEGAQQPTKEAVRAAASGMRIVSLLSMLVIGLLMLRFLPGILETGVGFMEKMPWQSVGFGLLKLILSPILAVILMVTVIGFPLGVFLVFFYIMELYFATYFAVFWIGQLVWSRFNKKGNKYWAFIIGAVVFTVITSIPVVSGLVRFFSLLFGLGAILLLKWSWYKKAFVK